MSLVSKPTKHTAKSVSISKDIIDNGHSNGGYNHNTLPETYMTFSHIEFNDSDTIEDANSQFPFIYS